MACGLPIVVAAQQTGPVWRWPNIPACVAETPSASRVNPSPTPKAAPAPTATPTLPPAPGGYDICAVWSVLQHSPVDVTVEKTLTAHQVNNLQSDFDYAAFQPGTMVLQIKVVGDLARLFHDVNRLVRFADTPYHARNGAWWTLFADVSSDGFTLRPIYADSDELALPWLPLCMASATAIATGAEAYVGMVAPSFLQHGGAVQFWFTSPEAIASTDPKLLDVPGGSACPRGAARLSGSPR